jgi:hypothetical protein
MASDFAGQSEQDQRLEKVAIDAVLRRASAQPYHYRTVHFRDLSGRVVWTPEAHACHFNVETWIKANPRHRRVRGFLLQGPLLNFWRVMAHSLIEVEDGSLIEITPQPDNQLHPFVRHIGTEGEFEEFADRTRLIVRPPR